MQASISCVSVGPRVESDQTEIRWGHVDCLQDSARTLSLKNTSWIPAACKIFLKMARSKYTLSAEEVQRIVDEDLVTDWTAEDYHVFDKNCVHFADALGARITQEGIPRPLLRGVLDVSERMLDSLPDWRRKLGRRVMNEVTRLVVVSWGRASKEGKEKAADKLGLERGE